MSVLGEMTFGTWVFVAVLGLVFAVALVGLWRVAAACSAEVLALEAIDEEAPAIRDGADARSEARARLEAADFRETTAVGERIGLLAESAAVQQLPDREVLASLAAARLRGPLALPRVIAGVLVLIGLAATLWGLTGAVSGLQRFKVAAAQPTNTAPLRDRMAEQSRQVDQLFEHIQTTLGGMQTAFVPALVGVGLTILLLFLIHRAQSRSGALLLRLERSTDLVLLSLFRPSGALGLDEAAVGARDAADGLLRSADQAAGALRDSVARLADRFAEAAKSAAEVIARGAQDGSASVARMVETLELRAQTEVDDRSRLIESATERLTLAARDGAAVVRAAVADRESVVRTALAELEASAKRMAECLGDAETVVGEARQRVEASGAAVERTAALEATLQKTLEGLSRRLDATDTQTGRISDASTLLVSVVEELRRDRVENARGTARWAEWLELDRKQRAEEAERIHALLERLDQLANEAADRNRQVADQVRTIQLTDHGPREQRAIDTVEALLEGARARDREFWDNVLERLDAFAASPSPWPSPSRVPEPAANGGPAAREHGDGGAGYAIDAPVFSRSTVDHASPAHTTERPEPSAERPEVPEAPVSLPRRLWIFLNRPIRLRRR
ncbi:MAG TPA: hypothetical protein VLK84_02590 [Longimicrobium sp.]|nr:hypothetical protein [Longimicrobium sp.]